MKFIVIHADIGVYLHFNLADALWDAKGIVDDEIAIHLRNYLPLKTDSEHPFRGGLVKDTFEVEVYAVSPTSQEAIELPFQGWLDEYYVEQKRIETEERVRELRKEALDKFAAYLDAASAGRPLPNSLDSIRNDALPLWELARQLGTT